MKKREKKKRHFRKLLIKLFDEVLAREIEERGVEGGEDLYFSEQRLNKKTLISIEI